MNRNNSLDALRGFAILAMVLSGSIAFGPVLPAWMFHAQVPPPYHVYDPLLPGITWVDLVFPFFLFSMGAAFPLALHKKLQQEPIHKTLLYIGQRYVLLVFFAIFTMHARAWVMSGQPTTVDHLISIGCFVLLFFMFVKFDKMNPQLALTLKLLAFALGVFFLWQYPFAKGFSITRSDVIIIVLANMALFGALIWMLTQKNPWLRIGILPFVMAIFLASKEKGSINQAIFDFTPAAWAYKFYYLKYLFIIIPGTIAGDWMLQRMKSTPAEETQPSKGFYATVALLGIGLNVLNTVCLFGRFLVFNLIATIVLLAILHWFLKKSNAAAYYKNLVAAGTYLLLLGLFFDAFEGGIKKDPSTYSYYFVTGGLAFFALLAFDAIGAISTKGFVHYLALNGKNPMVAYTAGNLVLIPLMKATDIFTYFTAIGSNAVGGFLQGVLFTGVVSAITVFFVLKKWYWKT
ncbi:uncharacterized protein DUF5009 [Chitinophaga skermanii]|uniref:Uncharacterized protein DUF5009 n=1 Tax=Chitinophaga skermanii TaxID=331697 RepID=A0A327R5G7_9BACT|nr:DUF5009 domain-containing protein [Chitinophaga skermanii]RAJ10944.1 uncharacterized protein DUF5009 [Chitinophaga skermanii]